MRFLLIILFFSSYANAEELKFYYYDSEIAATKWADLQSRAPVNYLEGNTTHQDFLDVVDKCRNGIVNGDDLELYGDSDHWATPEEYLTNKKGDCEDTAICMYYNLAERGFKNMRIVLGPTGKVGHAAILVRTEKGSFAMDNNLNEPIKEKDYIGTVIRADVFLHSEGITEGAIYNVTPEEDN